MPKLSQQELLDIFTALKKELKPYEKGNIKARMDIEGRYDLWSEKKGMFVYDRVRDEVAFAAIIIQSNYVGFYFMPVYATDGERIKKGIAPELLKLLKGKACFHIKSADKELLGQIRQAIRLGYDGYKKMGWV